jgi:hypothetical protein
MLQSFFGYLRVLDDWKEDSMAVQTGVKLVSGSRHNTHVGKGSTGAWIYVTQRMTKKRSE